MSCLNNINLECYLLSQFIFLNGLLWAADASSPMVRKVSFRLTFVLELNLGLAKADPPPVSAVGRSNNI